MIDPGRPRPTHRGDPVGFLILIVLLIVFGGAILFAIRWIAGLIAGAS